MAKKKQTSKKSNSKKKGANSGEEKLEVPGSLRALCILSFIGFIFCLVVDTTDYFTYANYEDFKNSADQTAYEQIETKLEEFRKNDIDISPAGLDKLARMSIYRSIIDVLAMVGTALMFFRIRRGYFIYAIFQFLYVALPFFMFGLATFAIFGKGALMIPLIYLGLFTTQVKHLNR